MSFSISNIKLGTPASKKYSRNMNFDNNTTMPFGFVQPLMSQRLEANSDISLNLKQVVRLAPMLYHCDRYERSEHSCTKAC